MRSWCGGFLVGASSPGKAADVRSKFDRLESRLRRKLGHVRVYHGRRSDPHPQYRAGFCEALEMVLKRMAKMKGKKGGA